MSRWKLRDSRIRPPAFGSALAPALALTLFGMSAAARARGAGSARCPLDDPRAGGRARGEITALVSPREPRSESALGVLFVSEKPVAGARVEIRSADGEPTAIERASGGGAPYWWHGRSERPEPGAYLLLLLDERGQTLACRRRIVRRGRQRPLPVGSDAWPIRSAWTRAMEALYAAWIDKLFDAQPSERPSWTPLHVVIRDPSRNVLHNHLGQLEDGPVARNAVVLKPDCADLPYYLRAYFAWKLGLPFGYRECDRGSSKRPARCGALRSNAGMLRVEAGGSAAAAFSRFLERQVSYVHSGSGRTAPDDDETDLYPVPLTREALWPGTVYVDPYGHLLVLALWVPQTDQASGALYAVDGHPDLSVGRKRFWRGAFLFSADTRGGAGGFKRFRPIVRHAGELSTLDNAALKAQRAFPAPSAEQYRLGDDGFYERMDELINPRRLGPRAAYAERLKAFFELIQERVDSVAAGEAYMRETRNRTIDMPKGPKIFETKGAWENFSTPARDLRLLIAIDDVLRFPDHVTARPDRYTLQRGETAEQARAALERQYAAYARAHAIDYLKSDGTKQRLTIADVVARRKALEVAYNPNDCVELRWGASGSELGSCGRRAPAAQREQMARYRTWFATRSRPPIR